MTIWERIAAMAEALPDSALSGLPPTAASDCGHEGELLAEARDRIATLEAEVARLQAELASYREEEAIDEIAYAEYRAAQHRIAEALGFSASWHLDIEFLTRIEGAVAALRARCERRDGDPTVEELRRVVYGDWADAPIARALLRAWGEEA